jgi:hypothetical protein
MDPVLNLLISAHNRTPTGDHHSPRRMPSNPDKPQSITLDATKIDSSDPPLSTVLTAYPAPPRLALFDPPIELAARRPCGRLDLDRRIDFAAVRFTVLARIEIRHV